MIVLFHKFSSYYYDNVESTMDYHYINKLPMSRPKKGRKSHAFSTSMRGQYSKQSTKKLYNSCVAKDLVCVN